MGASTVENGNRPNSDIACGLAAVPNTSSLQTWGQSPHVNFRRRLRAWGGVSTSAPVGVLSLPRTFCSLSSSAVLQLSVLRWDDLKYVLAVSDHGNASAAGRALRVDATTVSRRVKAVEQELDARLFDVRGGTMVLTAAGRLAVSTASRMAQGVNELDAELRGLEGELSGPLRVTSLGFLFEHWRSDIARFHRQHPEVELSLMASPRVLDLSRREADISIRLANSAPEHLVGRRFVEIFFAAYASVHVEPTIQGHPWIGWVEPYETANQSVIDEWAPGARVGLRVDSMTQLVRCIQDGLGISVLPCVVGDQVPDLRRVGEYFEGGVHLWALTHEQLRKTARVRAFMAFLGECVERDRSLLLGQPSQDPP